MLHIVTDNGIVIRDLYEGEITEELVAQEYARDTEAKEKARLAAVAAAREEIELRREHSATVMGEVLSEEAEKTDAVQEETASEEETAQVQNRPLGRFPKFNVLTAKYYIPEELCFRAENRFSRQKMAPAFLAIATVLFLGLGFLLIRYTPFLLGLLDRSLVAIFG